MARPANPNKEKIAALKTELKDQAKVVKAGERAAKKTESLQAKLDKLTGDAPVAKTAKTAKVAKDKDTKKASKSDKKKVSAADEKKAAKNVKAKKRGRPRKDADDDED